MVFTPNRQKVHSLTGRITPELVLAAFHAVKRNRGAAGIDKVSIQMFAANLDANLQSVIGDLKAGLFQPKPLRRRFIDKGNGKLRPLGIPAVRDRVAQEVLRRLLSPVFEPKFHDASFGFRPGRNCHGAIARVLEYHESGDWFVLDADIQGFFDNLSHDVIMEAVAAEVADGNILRLIEKFLRSGVMDNGVFKPTTVGTPQGGVISPLLANIVLNHLDWRLHQHGRRFVRYADDFVVVAPSQAQAEEARTQVEQVLRALSLTLSPDKTQITTYGKGYSFPWVRDLVPLQAHSPQIRKEISRQGARLDRTPLQLRRFRHRETQSSHSGHRALLLHPLLRHPPRPPAQAGQLDSHAPAGHVEKGQKDDRQLSAAHTEVCATWSAELGKLLLAVKR